MNVFWLQSLSSTFANFLHYYLAFLLSIKRTISSIYALAFAFKLELFIVNSRLKFIYYYWYDMSTIFQNCGFINPRVP